MSKINLLNSKIFNRIAAGEVVDRPYSVVKELVENAIDAGANNIEIEISNGGINSIRVSDNGCGIEKDDLKKALLPHATSKISTLKDLDNISTLGFRGEALPSIASVSKINIESKIEDNTLGYYIYAEGGEVLEFSECGCSKGTTVTVNNIFFNTPAREKFLRTPRSEESDISSTVARFILGNPNISFKYIADSEVIYQSFGDGLESAMVNIYGPSIIGDCYKIETEKNGFNISGYVGKHHFTKGNRSHQTIFINGRYVVNQTIASALSNAYSSYLMKHRYPFYVLNVSMPTSIVDINVHPNKLEVRFSNNQIVYGTIYSVVSKVLDGSTEAVNIISSNKEKNDTDKGAQPYRKELSLDSLNIASKTSALSDSLGKLVFHDKCIETEEDKITTTKKSEVVDIFAENKAYIEKLEREKALKNENSNVQVLKNSEQLTLNTPKNLTYIGQALRTYLIFEDGEDLYLVDQHAAHERILFDKLNEAVNNKSIPLQPMLIPYVLNVNNVEFDFIYNNVESLVNIGIHIEEFGKNAFKVCAVPVFLSSMNLDNFFKDILADMMALKSITVNTILEEKLAQKACKSAIKSGDQLDTTQVKVLKEKLMQNVGLKCPHGRPVCVKITRTEIDKWFKRII